MLTSLRISSLGVIDSSEIEPAPGLTAVTGETGAGKTMIVTGLGLLLGERATAGVVRRGADRAQVEGVFTGVESVAGRLAELGAETDDGELIVARRVFGGTGRSRAWLGGAPAPLGAVGRITGELATIHGQSEQLRLGTPERQREVLDAAGGAELAQLLQDYRAVFEERRRVIAELDERVRHARERAQERDLLAFGLDEISAVDPQPGEDARLAAQAERLQGLDDLRMLAESAGHALSGAADGDADDPGALGLVGEARRQVRRMADADAQAEPLAAQLDQLAILVQEAAVDLAGYLADLDADPGRLEAITSRRAALAALTRKYGADTDEVLAWAADARERLADLSGDDERIEQLRARRAELDARLTDRAARLHALRAEAAGALAEATGAELAALAMPHARLVFDIEPLPELGPHGGDQVRLLFSANPGTAPAPLARVASGGELSRVRLALEVVLAGGAQGHTFVFDEVDAGVGGRVATEIGRRLKRLAAHSQVIVVTHLAQVAAFADTHLVVAKSTDGQVTSSDVHRVEGADREAEIARLMAGTVSDTALRHARELLAQASQG
ncbi:DNA repair protein RecN [Propionibacterium australiense]|uniref:DNA repair protein RecN n=1 Tax=Propionibacterium australiense TaxID=119981 RepID=A0A8B3FPE5_9ACTN|nr:DNA repair protein RecN [Propionibacterium australiense]RLP06940.1 DNA repair protein RecN [Propionibacterium australiense]